LVVPCIEAATPDFLALLASLAENKLKRSDYSGRDGDEASINEIASPEIFSVFCG
jgi:hypothetical protein